MIEKESNYIQQIYRIILFLIGLWFINLIWPYISDVILMLVFAFLFTTVLLSSVDAFERRIGNRGLSVLGVVIMGLFLNRNIDTDKEEEGLQKAMGDYVYKFWHLLDETLNAILFILIGLEIILIFESFDISFLFISILIILI